jgi:sigma-B regulation protein RsbU (phosphoserine phosphatase)
MGMAVRFALTTTLALAVVMGLAGYFLFEKTGSMIDAAVDGALRAAVHAESQRSAVEAGAEDYYTQASEGASEMDGVRRFDVDIQSGRYKGAPAYLYQVDAEHTLVAPRSSGDAREGLYGLVLVVTGVVILVGATVSMLVALRVSRPLNILVDDVRAITRGNLHHRTKVRGGGEVGHLARTIDKMAEGLREAQDAEVELGVREREREVAMEVSDALLPESTPQVPGYEIADAHVGSPEPGGDFLEYVEVGNRICLLVCDVSGTGVPGALVGATARAYLKSELERGEELAESLKKVNRDIARDVKRGMYVTALCVLLDPTTHTALVACAGHKLPLIRYEASSGQLKLLQPGGIALGFDKGPVFDRSLQLNKVPMEPGDRLVLASTGAVRVLSEDGVELGEKGFYRSVARYAKASSERMLEKVLNALENHAGEEPFPTDISLVVLSRDA